MVLTTRSVDRIQIDAKRNVYDKPPQTVLELVAGEKMIGLLKQVGQLSDFAADIFANLFRDSMVVFQRIGHLNERVTYIEQYIPQVEQIFYTTQPAYFYKEAQGGAPFKRSDRNVGALFSAEYRPEPVSRVRAAAQPPPNVALLNDFAKSHNCLAAYSDPSFFFQQWLKAEEERQKKLIEENQAKKSKKKKKPAEAKKTQVKQVEVVKIKTFSAQGKEFEPSVSAPNTSRSVTEEPPLVEYEEEQEDEPSPTGSPTATTQQLQQAQAQAQAQAQYQQQQLLAQQQQQQSAAQLAAQREAQAKYEAEKAEYERQQAIYQQQLEAQRQQQAAAQAAAQAQAQQTPPSAPAYGAPPPPPIPGGPSVAPPPPVPSLPPGGAFSTAPPPPTPPPFQRPPTAPVPPVAPVMAAPVPPVAPVMSAPVPPTPPPMAIPIPPAPPVAPVIDAPEAPPMSPGGYSGPSTSALLDGIRAGVTLKKAEAPPAAPAGRTGLLAEIRSRGFQLNKVDREEIENKKPVMGGGGGLNSIMDILARRSAIQGSSDSGSGSDDDWKE